MYSFVREFRSLLNRKAADWRTSTQLAFAATLAVLFVFPAAAQTTFATITGTVTDPGGAIISNATIEATHLASNYRYEAQSNSAGNYTLAQLREGEYVLRATAPGFSTYEVKDIQLAARDLRRVDINLTVGAVQTA